MSGVIKSLYVVENKLSPDFFLSYRACVVSNPKTVSKYERVFSDHFDFVAPESFNGNVNPFQRLFKYLNFFKGHATVADFQEDDPEQAYIRPRNFYRRYTIEPKARKLLVKSFFSRKFSHCLPSRFSSTAQTWIKNMCLFDPLRT